MLRRSAAALSRRVVGGGVAAKPVNTRMFTPSITRCTFLLPIARLPHRRVAEPNCSRMEIWGSEKGEGAEETIAGECTSFKMIVLADPSFTADASHDGDPKPGEPTSKMVPFEGTWNVFFLFSRNQGMMLLA